MDFLVTVNNVKPSLDPSFVLPPIAGIESGSPNIVLPEIKFLDPATQYDISSPNEVWTYWWDLDDLYRTVGVFGDCWRVRWGHHWFDASQTVASPSIAAWQ